MQFIAEDYLPDITAQVGFMRHWLAERPDLEPGTNGLARPGDRAIGKVALAWRGATIEVGVMPYRLYLLQKVQDAVSGAGDPSVGAMLEATGLTPLLDLKAQRRVERQGHLEVWGGMLEDPF